MFSVEVVVGREVPVEGVGGREVPMEGVRGREGALHGEVGGRREEGGAEAALGQLV